MPVWKFKGAATQTEQVGSKFKYGIRHSFEILGVLKEQDENYIGIHHLSDGITGAIDYALFKNDGTKKYEIANNGSVSTQNRSSNLEAQTRLAIKWLPGELIFEESDSEAATFSSGLPDEDCGIRFSSKGTQSFVEVDWAFVRKLTSPEPEFDSAGWEEDPP